MHARFYLDNKNILLFFIFIVFSLSTRILSCYYSIDEYRESFVKKSLDIYNMKTKGLQSLPKAVDFVYLGCNENQIEVSAAGISNYIQSKPSNNYQININIPNSGFDTNIESIKLKLFNLERIRNNIWSMSYISLKNGYPERYQQKRLIFLYKNTLQLFLSKIFQIYKSIRTITHIFNDVSNFFVSIEDTNDGITKKIPKRYLSEYIDSFRDPNEGIWIKIFSESEILDNNVSKNKMIQIFKNFYSKWFRIPHLNYTLYILDSCDFELDESQYTKKVLKKTILNQYFICRFSTLSNNTDQTEEFFLSQNFKFEHCTSTTEFEYLYSTKNTEDEDYKFKLSLKCAYLTFEFNFNWYSTRHPITRYWPESLLYIYVIAGTNFDILEISRHRNRKYFVIKRANTIVSSLFCDFVKDLKYVERNFIPDQLFDHLVFKRRI
ncbi:hypothetical protein CWI36_0844p0010 [Hamiltosporidium magnivora]|uniref:Uncharacterized protein n=1 Tax=Hamiltosporidium magnivora TaxID=148818 RepID=A0A4Q9L920_9MICR|nr:hypothetical protein CWI36_0844p0010 [Hamiltosporidium magnivora]